MHHCIKTLRYDYFAKIIILKKAQISYMYTNFLWYQTAVKRKNTIFHKLSFNYGYIIVITFFDICSSVFILEIH